jgi:hypothetical protein
VERRDPARADEREPYFPCHARPATSGYAVSVPSRPLYSSPPRAVLEFRGGRSISEELELRLDLVAVTLGRATPPARARSLNVGFEGSPIRDKYLMVDRGKLAGARQCHRRLGGSSEIPQASVEGPGSGLEFGQTFRP